MATTPEYVIPGLDVAHADLDFYTVLCHHFTMIRESFFFRTSSLLFPRVIFQVFFRTIFRAHDLRRPYSASFIFVLIAFGLLSGCSTATSKIAARSKTGIPVSRVFNAKFNEVETALKQTMVKYPQRVDNSDAGIFETDFLKGEARFRPAHNPDIEFSNGFRYRIIIRVVKGRASEHQMTKVQVLKQAETVRDFFSGPEAHSTDGLEEDAILYRIGREITIARGLAKAAETAPAADAL